MTKVVQKAITRNTPPVSKKYGRKGLRNESCPKKLIDAPVNSNTAGPMQHVTASNEERIIPDLERRFYLARNNEEVEKNIDLFAKGNLDSKFSSEFRDK